MSEATLRAAIYAAVNGVSNKGVCYDYERWAATWPEFLTLFKTTIGGTDQIRGWEVVYRGQQAERDPQFERHVFRTHQFVVQGYMGVDDSAATEKTFAALAEDVCDAIDSSATLHVTGKRYPATSPATLAAFEPRMFGGVLVHFAQISLTVMEEAS